MANVRVINAVEKHRNKRRVGVYVRVSTDSEDQQNSYASQIKYYTALIEKNPDLELTDVYADEGITGTQLDHRDDFLRMMRDARRGKLDQIFVKSVSRFARNTKDCLAALRELSLLGVTVRFDRDNLNTETLTTELMVSVSGSLAQEESISMSQNMRWSYQKRMQSGKFITCNPPFGYRLQNGKELVIAEDEAEIVRWIPESEIYSAFMRMAAKLKENLNIVIAPAITQLQELTAAANGENLSMLAITKEISELYEKNLILSRLREKNLIPTDSYLSKNSEISSRLAELKRQRRLLIETDDEGHALQSKLRELLHIMKENELKDGFDEQLFSDITEKVIVDSQESIRFRLLSGIEFEEQIKGKLR